MHPYEARNVRFLRVISHHSWRLKLYSIALDRPTVDESRFTAGYQLALDALPAPAVTATRPGAAFCILHQGRGADYVVLGWWDRENELPLRIFVKTPADHAWRPAQGSESVCVWDLEVISFERDAYVTTVLAEPALPVDDYLDAVFEKSVAITS